MSPQMTRGSDQTIATAPADQAPARFVFDGRLARIRGQSILFNASQQAVFAINDTAADIWLSLEEGDSPEVIASRIAGSGVDPGDANRYVETALEDWERLELIRPDPPSAAEAARDHVSQVVALPGIHVRIDYPNAYAYPALTVFRHLEARDKAASIQIQLVEHGDRIRLFRTRRWIASCTPEELPSVLKARLLGEVLERGAYEIALHAAALVKDERNLLLCGGPGAGKTTLTLALVNAGFGYAGDDVTLLDSRGRGLGIPFAPGVKAGAWPVLTECRPDLDAAPVFRRPDRTRVRYLVPKDYVPPVPRSIGWVVLLRRSRSAKPCLEPIDPTSALRGLLNGSFAPGRKLTGTAFDLLVQVIGSADAYCLNYSRLDDAVELIRKECR